MASEATDYSVNDSRGWLRRPRTLIATAVAVVLLAAGGVVLLSIEDSPVPVIQEYLDTIRSGNTEAAMRLAGHPMVDGPFLSAKALADDWHVDKVVARHQTDDMAEVDVTISAGGHSQHGRFNLRKFDGDWKIQNPIVEVTLETGLLDMFELGGEAVPREQLESAPAVVGVQVSLFPGAYRLYPSLADRVTLESTHLLALPHEETQPPVAITGELTPRGADLARQTFNDHLDNCVKQTVGNPKGCPFGAPAYGGGEYTPDVMIDDDIFTEVRDVSWQITTRPEVTFEPTAGGFVATLGKPGTLRMTASGIPLNDSESGRVSLVADCGVYLKDLRLVPAQDGFTLLPGHLIGVAFSDARCRRPVG